MIYKEDSANNAVRFLFKEDEIKEDKLYTFYNRYLLISNEGEISPSDAAKKQAPVKLQKSFNISNSSGVQIGDTFNYYLRSNESTGPTISLVMFVPDGTVKNNEEFNEMKVLFDQILSTFQFTQ